VRAGRRFGPVRRRGGAPGRSSADRYVVGDEDAEIREERAELCSDCVWNTFIDAKDVLDFKMSIRDIRVVAVSDGSDASGIHAHQVASTTSCPGMAEWAGRSLAMRGVADFRRDVSGRAIAMPRGGNRIPGGVPAGWRGISRARPLARGRCPGPGTEPGEWAFPTGWPVGCAVCLDVNRKRTEA
jgi:hypothetical protein